MRPDARRLADHGHVEMGDEAAARRYALDGKAQETVGGGAAPLRIAGRKMGADVAFGERPENGVDQRMQHHVGIGMAGQGLAMRDAHAAEHDMIAVAEGMHVDAGADAQVAQRACKQRFGAGEILRSASASYCPPRRQIRRP